METTMTEPRVKTAEAVAQLNTLLATYQVHYQRLRAFHWTVRGQHFFELHRQFETLYKDAAQKCDEIAERILMLGHSPLRLYSEYLRHAEVQETNPTASLHPMVTMDMAALVAKDFEVLRSLENKCLALVEDSHDAATADLLTTHLAFIEKQLWMWRAWMDVNE